MSDGVAFRVRGAAAMFCAVLACSAAGGQGRPFLWQDDFTGFRPIREFSGTEADYSAWLVTDGLHAMPLAGGGIRCSERSAGGWSFLRGRRPHDPAYRFLQVHYAAHEPRAGYRFLAADILDAAGKAKCRSAISTVRPGIYTVDTHYVSSVFREGNAGCCVVRFVVYGPSKGEGGLITPGTDHTIGWVRLARQPLNGLAVTMADGAPLGDVIRKGDTLRFRACLERPAKDVSVEVLVARNYQPFPLNGQPYVQLRKADGKMGKAWEAQVTIGAATGTFDGTRSPVLFQAIIADGRVWRTYASAFVSFE